MKFRLILSLLALLSTAYAWGNGYSVYDDPIFVDYFHQWQTNPMYGTHDYLAEYALEFLPEEERAWIEPRMYYFGTELPDSNGYRNSINDRPAQYLLFDEDGNVYDDMLADRSMRKYDVLIGHLENEEWGYAAQWAGTTASYVSDAGLFSRVIRNSQNGLKHEQSVQLISALKYPSDKFEELYGGYIAFDGSLEMISPYDAVMKVGSATFMGKKDGSCYAEWMDENYDPEDPEFIDCAGRNLNNIVNAIADVLHTIYQRGVNGVDYETYQYDWEDYGNIVFGVPMEEEPPEEIPEVVEPVVEEPEEEPIVEEVVEEPVIEVPKIKTSYEGGTWIYIIVIVFIAAVVLLTLRKTGKSTAKKKLKKRKKRRR